MRSMVSRSAPKGQTAINAAQPFKGRQYAGEIILTAVRWYLRYPLVYEHVSEMLKERSPALEGDEQE
jgi:hypothetical protein